MAGRTVVATFLFTIIDQDRIVNAARALAIAGGASQKEAVLKFNSSGLDVCLQEVLNGVLLPGCVNIAAKVIINDEKIDF